jgi:hypothetical protein
VLAAQVTVAVVVLVHKVLTLDLTQFMHQVEANQITLQLVVLVVLVVVAVSDCHTQVAQVTLERTHQLKDMQEEQQPTLMRAGKAAVAEEAVLVESAGMLHVRATLQEQEELVGKTQ